MDGVEAVVEDPPVHELAHEVAGVVPLALAVAAVVLQGVHRDDAPLRVEVRDDPEHERLLPVEDEERHGHGEERHELEEELAEPLGVPLVHRLRVDGVGPHDRGHDREHEEDAVQEVVLEADLRRAHHVTPRLGVLVMAEVVPRDVARDRVAVDERQDHLVDLVHPLEAEDGRVDRVVGLHRPLERRHAERHEDGHLPPGEGVLNPQKREDREVEGIEREGADVRREAKKPRLLSFRGLHAGEG